MYVYRMKILTAFVAASLFFISCNQIPAEFKERLNGADSIAINYFNTGGKMDSVVAVKIIRDKKPIEELTSFIAQGEAVSPDKKSYGYNGSVHFFKNDMVVQDVYFCNSKECNLFVFSFNGKWHSINLSGDAASLLSSTQTK